MVDSNGIRRFIGAHRLVALAYIHTHRNTKYLEVNHINRNRTDNRVGNLEWVTHMENVRYSRGKRLLVTWDSGKKQIFPCAADFIKKYPSKVGVNVYKYINEYSRYSKKHKMSFRYLD